MEFSAESIAALIKGKVEGDPQAAVYTFAKIEEGHPGALSFLANPKYTHFIYETKSTIVLVSNDFVAERPITATLIRVQDPYEAIAHLLEIVKQATTQLPTGVEQPSFVAEGVDLPQGVYVGAFAYIGRGAKLGKDVKIYPQAYVGEGVEIGEGTIINPGVKIYHGCKIGKRCIIHSGAVIGADGFGFAPDADGTYSKIPQMGIVEIGDDVEIGANTTIDRAMMGATRLANGVKLDNLIQIAHNVQVGRNTAMAAQAGIAGSAKIGDNCMIGGQVGVSGHITIGNRAQIGAQAGIPNSVKEGVRLLGTPAVPALDFAKQCALMKRLPDLFNRVESLEKQKK
ncbi:MAG: UDP-3-O-(3-hydroxymyristoyl)glucosamine N-acyltransferase [Muribaculaceae bacterium]|nr:UDP-3-O-(3-hydroxymyristoyl)glucosamine N-acyltransferase [Muribaculaceae bacterium]